MSKYRSSLSQARGLGSAKDGVGHWWAQRLTAIALIPLTLWLVFGLACVVGRHDATFEFMTAWVAKPYNAIPLLLFIGAALYHSALGVQVVIEDYVNNEGCKIAALIFTKLAHAAVAIACIFAVLKISL